MGYRFVLAGVAAVFFAASAFAESIRLGWQLPWATQGQLVMALKQSNIPELAGIDLEYVDFTYGGPLNQAALAGDVDILLTADQPAAVLIARGDKHRIVARMMYNRTCIYVPTGSNVENLTDLNGAHIAGPVGAAAERIAMADLSGMGVNIDALEHSKLDMGQQAALVRQSEGASSWGTIDALYGFDPLPAAFEEQDLVKMLSCGKVLSLVLASDEMIEERPEELAAFLRAFHAAWALYAEKPDEMNKAFLNESGLEMSQAALEIAAAVEPNRFANDLDDLRLSFTQEDAAIFKTSVQFLMDRGIIDKDLELESSNVSSLDALESVVSTPEMTGQIIDLMNINQ